MERFSLIKNIFKGKNMKNSRKGLIIFLLILCVFVVTGGILVRKYYPRWQAELKFYFMQKEVDKKEKKNADSDGDTAKATVNFASLKAENPDVIGWIKVPGTEINYPVLMSSADKDTDYYLSYTFDGKKSRPGCIYVEKEQSSDFSDFNTIIYGHNMRNGTMFGTLKRYKDEDFFQSHPEFTIETENRLLTYKVYVSIRMDNRHLLHSYDMTTSEGRQQYLDDISKGTDSYFHQSDIKPTTEDHLITLSTCIGQDQTHRFLLVGVLEKSQAIKQ